MKSVKKWFKWALNSGVIWLIVGVPFMFFKCYCAIFNKGLEDSLYFLLANIVVELVWLVFTCTLTVSGFLYLYEKMKEYDDEGKKILDLKKDPY